MERVFERSALIFAAGLVGGLAVLAVVNPPEATTAAPKADLELELRDMDVAGAAGFLPVKACGSEALLPAIHVRSPGRKRVPAPLETAENLNKTFENLGYDLKSIGEKGAPVPRVFLASLPSDLGDIREVPKRKALFFKTVLPLVLQVNEEILADRRRLWDLRSRLRTGKELGPIDRLWLIVMAEQYRAKRGDIDELIKRVDVIPPSLALAQAAEESGWGTSRFVREGNAMFGEWTFGKSQGIVPNKRDAGKRHKVKIFKDLLASVRAYARNLNTHRAYRELRSLRADLRKQGEKLDGMALTKTLTRYSERGQGYVKTLRSIIIVNKLRRFDGARLQGDNKEPVT